MNQVALTILQQLGGSRFIAMTGARDFVGGENHLAFRINGRTNGRRVNRVRIALEASDTYDAQVFNVHALDYRMVDSATDVYAENLRETFERLTGLYTSL